MTHIFEVNIEEFKNLKSGAKQFDIARLKKPMLPGDRVIYQAQSGPEVVEVEFTAGYVLNESSDLHKNATAFGLVFIPDIKSTL